MQCPHCGTTLLLTSQSTPPPFRPGDVPPGSMPNPSQGAQATGHSLTASTRAYEKLPWFQQEGSINVLIILGMICFPPALWAALIIVMAGPVFRKPKTKRPQLTVWGFGQKIAAFFLLILQLAGIYYNLGEIKKILWYPGKPKPVMQQPVNLLIPNTKHKHAGKPATYVLVQYQRELFGKTRSVVDAYMEIQPVKTMDNNRELFFKVSVSDPLTGIEFKHLRVQMGGLLNTCNAVNLGKAEASVAKSTSYEDLKLPKIGSLINLKITFEEKFENLTLNEIIKIEGEPDLVRDGGTKLFYKQSFRLTSASGEEKIYRCIQIDLDDKGIFKNIEFLELEI